MPARLRLSAILFLVFPLALAAGPLHISGRVQLPAETAQGLAGARVELLSQTGEVPVATTKTDSAGFFELTAPESGCFRVRLRAQGYLDVENPLLPLVENTELPVVPALPSKSQTAESAEPQSFQGWVFGAPAPATVPPPQPAPRLVQGKVSDPKGAPVAGALVWSEGSPAGPCVKTGPEGAFEIRLPAGGGARLRAVAVGYLPSNPREPSPSGAKPVALKLEPAGSITGRVVDAAGQPLVRAQITALPFPMNDDSSRYEVTWSRTDGRFRLPLLSPGKLYELTASQDGFAPASVKVDARERGGRHPAPVRIVLDRGATILGRVVDPEGRPVRGAELTLSPSQAGMFDQELSLSSGTLGKATADSTGAFAIPRLVPGRFQLRVTGKGFAAHSLPDVEVPSRTAKVDLGALTLEHGLVIEGQVTDPRGAPLAGAEVDLTPTRDALTLGSFDAGEFQAVRTDSEGRFRFEGLRRGARFDVGVQHPRYVPAAVRSLETPVPEPLRIELKAGRTLSGRVKGPTGEPVRQASVFLKIDPRVQGWSGQRPLGTTDAEGRFRFAGVEPGTVELEIGAEGYRPAHLKGVRVPEESDVEGLEVTLSPGSRLEIHVLDSRRQPVAGAWIVAHPANPVLTQQGFAQGRTDDEGLCRLEGLDLGPYRVSAQSEKGHAEAAVEIAPGVNRRDLVFAAGVEVSGRVSDETGAPVAGASLSLMSMETGDSFSAASSGDGTFRFPAVADGSFHLSASAPGFAESAAPDEIQVAGQEIRGLLVRLSRGAVVTGKVLGLDAKELENVAIFAFRTNVMSQRPRLARTDSEGRYKLSDLSAGDWKVSAQAGGRRVEETLQLAPGVRDAVLDLRFPTSGFTLTGRVVADHAPLAGAQVWASSGGGSFQAVTGPGGGFQLSNLPSGHYTLSVSGPEEGVGTSANVDLDGDREVILDFTTGGLRGTISAADSGAPVANALVRLSGSVPMSQPARTTDGAGKFDVPRLSSGTYTLFIEKEGFAPVRADVKVPPGGVAAVRISLNPAP